MKKFKVGDWVRVIDDNELFQIKAIDNGWFYRDVEYNVGYMDNDLELWVPKRGEWCWVWNVHMTRPLPARAVEITEDGTIKTEAIDGQSFWKYYEPYIGKLPTKLKELNDGNNNKLQN